jgi:hypothetical protein
MPTYCYSNERTGQVVERVFRMGEAPARIRVGRVWFDRDFGAERVAVPATSGWPLTCYASGVNAEDAQALRDYLAQKGVPTEVTADGDPIYRNSQHRKKALKARGKHDRASYD